MPAKKNRRPYFLLGAGQVMAHVWKTGSDEDGWQYPIVFTRMNSKSGHVTQRFRASDIRDLVKLLELLAFEIGQDGDVSTQERDNLRQLAFDIRAMLAGEKGGFDFNLENWN